MKQKKNLLIALFLTPYIFLVNICFRTEKKSYPQKKIISLCEIKTTEKNNNSTYNLLVCYVHVNNPPIQNKKQKKCLEKKF